MKTFNQLSPEQKSAAQAKALNHLLEAICEQQVVFAGTPAMDSLQDRIDAAVDEANRMQTPWFYGEYIMDTCRADLTALANADAERALYREPGELVLCLA